MALKPQVLQGWPPGGWLYYEPSTDWHAPNPLQFNFDQQADNIVAMRKKNPAKSLPTDKATAAADLEAFTEARLSKVYSRAGVKKFLTPSPADLEAQKKTSPGTHPSRSVLGSVAAVAGVDLASLEDWLGNGGVPVNQTLADTRAGTCVNCVANKKGGWLELLTVPAAKAIRSYLSLKHGMKLQTPLDSKLGSCEACDCVLELKVWQPIEFVKENTTPETMEKHRNANPDCWVLKGT